VADEPIDEESLDVLFDHALNLHARGADEAAKAAYLAVLFRDTTHLGALTNLGTLLHATGYRTAARTAYKQAVDHHHEDVTARINYGNALYQNDEYDAARDQYEATIALDPECAQAHQGLAYVFDKMGDPVRAARHRDLGYRGHAIVHLPYRGDGRAIMVLLLLSAFGGNVRTDEYLPDTRFFVTKLFAEYYDAQTALPFHSFVFNAIGDAELCATALAKAREALARTNAPVINDPAAVEATSRAANAARLTGLPGVTAPRTASFPRAALAGDDGAQGLADAGFAFPLLLRTPGFHTGQYFARVDSERDLDAAVAELPGKDLLAIELLDARGADGRWRKYRVMIVDGRLYPLHLAVASHWKVHYFSADMAANESYRLEEEAFLGDMPRAIGAHAIDALDAICKVLALDYGGIDFGLDRDGNVLLFEANATMMVPPPDSNPIFIYRRPATEQIFAAVETMLLDRASF
jgi:glutathione synthase/RimK-type ligase-like ATP-grasp enzyme